MTVEAAVAKISYLLGHDDYSFSDVRKKWRQSIRGERSTGAMRVRPPKGLIARKRNFPRLSHSELTCLYDSFSKDGVIDADRFFSGMQKIDVIMSSMRKRDKERCDSFEEHDLDSPVKREADCPPSVKGELSRAQVSIPAASVPMSRSDAEGSSSVALPSTPRNFYISPKLADDKSNNTSPASE